MQLSNLCRSILESDEKILLVAIINSKGRVVEAKMRDDRVTKDLTDQKREMFFMQIALKSAMHRDFDGEFGLTKYAYSIREKISTLSFLLNDYTGVVICDPSINPLLLIQNISEIINKCDNLSNQEISC